MDRALLWIQPLFLSFLNTPLLLFYLFLFEKKKNIFFYSPRSCFSIFFSDRIVGFFARFCLIDSLWSDSEREEPPPHFTLFLALTLEMFFNFFNFSIVLQLYSTLIINFLAFSSFYANNNNNKKKSLRNWIWNSWWNCDAVFNGLAIYARPNQIQTAIKRLLKLNLSKSSEISVIIQDVNQVQYWHFIIFACIKSRSSLVWLQRSRWSVY